MAVLVRRKELACRTGWDVDLWEAAGSDRVVDVYMLGPFDPEPAPDRPRLELVKRLRDDPDLPLLLNAVQEAVPWQTHDDSVSYPFAAGLTDAVPARPPGEESPVPRDAPEPPAENAVGAQPPPAAPWPAVAGGATGSPAPFVGIEDVVARETEAWAGPRLAATAPLGAHQVCRTCRDFQAEGDGTHGWCMNRWAFPEPRCVQANALSCWSTLGCWWLPHDQAWLGVADASQHGRPTPLLDSLLRDQRP